MGYRLPRKFNPTTYERLAEVAQALNGFDSEQGDIARRNARAELRKTLRKLEAAVDVAYPAPKRKVERGTRRTGAAYKRALEKEGYVDVKGSGGTVEALAVAGVKVIKINWKEHIHNANDPVRSYDVHYSAVMAPGWSVSMIGKVSASKLAEAASNPAYRKALITELALKSGAGA